MMILKLIVLLALSSSFCLPGLLLLLFLLSLSIRLSHCVSLFIPRCLFCFVFCFLFLFFVFVLFFVLLSLLACWFLFSFLSFSLDFVFDRQGRRHDSLLRGHRGPDHARAADQRVPLIGAKQGRVLPAQAHSRHGALRDRQLPASLPNLRGACLLPSAAQGRPVPEGHLPSLLRRQARLHGRRVGRWQDRHADHDGCRAQPSASWLCRSRFVLRRSFTITRARADSIRWLCFDRCCCWRVFHQCFFFFGRSANGDRASARPTRGCQVRNCCERCRNRASQSGCCWTSSTLNSLHTIVASPSTFLFCLPPLLRFLLFSSSPHLLL